MEGYRPRLIASEEFKRVFDAACYTLPHFSRPGARMGRIILVFVRRLGLPLLVLAAFLGVCVVFYMRVEGLRALDVLFWVISACCLRFSAATAWRHGERCSTK